MDVALFTPGIILLVIALGFFAYGRRASRLFREANQKYHWPEGAMQAGYSNYLGGFLSACLGVTLLMMGFFTY